ncbi:FxLYD domain-containing protein [Streptomyces sp. NBC_01381]|uniref:FxLYD domain-containing protein n=1 Tax=Streptomyces sp. NBC_01381 TaxID=2903845 RepID=UPI002252EAA6|nr:FxLYD domain-containing protein [Streptomyces sp. NBC_01381]MCX4665449.1 FxLYD domain-containing protein [Streptomyces sp. NBC_01381]
MEPTRTATATRVAAAACTALLALTVTACTDEDVDKAKDTVASATAKAGDVVASATEAAASELAKVKDGVNAKGDVKAADAKPDGDRITAEITATNSSDKKADYTISVNFRDSDGNLLDAVVLNINGVDPGSSKSGTARSNRSLSGTPKVEIGQALRH